MPTGKTPSGARNRMIFVSNYIIELVFCLVVRYIMPMAMAMAMLCKTVIPYILWL